MELESKTLHSLYCEAAGFPRSASLPTNRTLEQIDWSSCLACHDREPAQHPRNCDVNLDIPAGFLTVGDNPPQRELKYVGSHASAAPKSSMTLLAFGLHFDDQNGTFK
eukprot:Skav232482  [mRNA]  locus=scaffold2877:264060:266094:- [translate_table: standard]